jgi:ElaB/YqjD/DUF883 family membrane-anchored ribosome-binding protein
MAQDPELIRRDIEATRRHMGDTVDALAYKADVPGRARDRVTGAFDSVKERIGGAGDSVGEHTPDAEAVKGQAKRAAGVAQENPLGLAIGAAAVGFLAGMLAPSTRVEDERLGPVADQVKDQIRETGQEALEHGRQVAQEAAGTAREQAQQAVQEVKETAQQSAQEHGEELKASAEQNAQQVTSS